MSKTTIHKSHILLALLLTAVLTGSILIKPVHILLTHHDRSGIMPVTPGQKTLSILHHHDCAICDFEFCSFIPQKQVIVPQVTVISIIELASRTVACFTNTSSHNFQLRAPPVC
jgi:hypothetical protein